MTKTATYRLRIFLCLLAMSLPADVAVAETDEFGKPLGDVYEFYGKEWVEKDIPTPKLSDRDEWLYFKVYASSLKHYINAQALHVSAGDNVARYVVAIESPSGVRNYFYEGIRCSKREYKTYAAAVNDTELKPMTDPQWRPIRQAGSGAFRFHLYRDYLCSDTNIRAEKDVLLRRFRSSEEQYSDPSLVDF